MTLRVRDNIPRGLLKPETAVTAIVQGALQLLQKIGTNLVLLFVAFLAIGVNTADGEKYWTYIPDAPVLQEAAWGGGRGGQRFQFIPTVHFWWEDTQLLIFELGKGSFNFSGMSHLTPICLIIGQKEQSMDASH